MFVVQWLLLLLLSCMTTEAWSSPLGNGSHVCHWVSEVYGLCYTRAEYMITSVFSELSNSGKRMLLILLFGEMCPSLHQ